jgi:hypothetical protein
LCQQGVGFCPLRGDHTPSRHYATTSGPDTAIARLAATGYRPGALIVRLLRYNVPPGSHRYRLKVTAMKQCEV